MTYLGFHALFILPPIAILSAMLLREGAASRRDLGVVAALCAIALAYTTPWDNYLVFREVWSYGEDRVLGTIGYVPVEEYLFFALQPILTGFWLLLVQHRFGRTTRTTRSFTPRRIGSVAGLLITIAGVFCLFEERTLYLGLILSWAGPVLAGQWFIAGERFMNRAAATGIIVPSLYLWIADRIAIGGGIWEISDRYTVGWEPLGLPIEEAAFFLMTNVLVVQGIIMFQRRA